MDKLKELSNREKAIQSWEKTPEDPMAKSRLEYLRKITDEEYDKITEASRIQR